MENSNNRCGIMINMLSKLSPLHSVFVNYILKIFEINFEFVVVVVVIVIIVVYYL